MTIPWGQPGMTIPWGQPGMTIPWGQPGMTIPWGQPGMTILDTAMKSHSHFGTSSNYSNGHRVGIVVPWGLDFYKLGITCVCGFVLLCCHGKGLLGCHVTLDHM